MTYWLCDREKRVYTLGNTKDKKKIKGDDKIAIKGRVCMYIVCTMHT